MSWLRLWLVGFDIFLSCGGCVWGWANVSGVFTECEGDGFLGIIDLFYQKPKEIKETTMSIYIRIRGVSFLKITSSMRSMLEPLRLHCH